MLQPDFPSPESPSSATPLLRLPKPGGAFRVVHTADWHLGKTLGDLDRTEEHRHFLCWLESVIFDEKVDALIVAGDIFDSATPPQSAVRLYFDFLASLHRKSDCRVIITSGNHDSPSHLESPRDLLRVINVDVATAIPLTEGDSPQFDPAATLIALPSPEHPRLVVAAVPFLRERDLRTGRLGQDAAEIARELRHGIESRYTEIAEAAQPWLERGIPVMASGHLTALGASSSDSEREIHIGGLGSVGAEAFAPGFSYVALGHLHRPQAVGGQARIRYCGSPIALGFGEAGDCKEIRVLDFVQDRLVSNQPLPVPQARRLIQLRIAHTDLKPQLRDFEPPASPLPAWLEVVVTGANGSEDLYKTVQEAVASRPFKVIRVIAERTAPLSGLGLSSLDNETDESAGIEAETLLADPKAVFHRRLEREPLAEPERAAIATAFGELCSLLDDRKRDHDH